MTKKLDEFVKEQNKYRRSALTMIKHILENKKTSITLNFENILDHYRPRGTDEMKIYDTGMRKITLEWYEKPMKVKK